MHDIRNKFSSDFNCPTSSVQVEQKSEREYAAEGCGQTAFYDCDGRDCKMSDVYTRDDDDPAPMAARAQSTQTPGSTSSAQVVRSADRMPVALDIQLPNRALLKLRAAPDKYGEKVQLKISRIEDDDAMATCEVDVMVNGQRLRLPKPQFSRQKVLSSLVTNVPREVVQEIGVAQQFAIRVCQERWSFGAEQLMQLHEFVNRYQEELAWLRDPENQTGAGLLAPSGGWPAWKAADKAPAPVLTGNAFDAQELFKLLSPSIFQVEAVLAGGSSYGSGVAVTAGEIATNCHVLEGARKIIVKQKNREWVAKIARSDPKRDRCVLALPDAALVPVRGVRAYKDLKVGEALFTLGAPSGLDQTLANGILSGLRDVSGRQLVQTTAPISPGSSGGGLFDARGNLVGITTLVLVGKERLNQALNFAIPADSFWAP